MAFVVLYDACVLYPAQLRDLLISLAVEGCVQARWSELILAEMVDAILGSRSDIPRESLERTCELMNAALPSAMVTGHEVLIEGLELPDHNDRHVLAAAIECGAQVIVTFNMKDFPADALALHDIEAKHPDDFVVESMDLAEGKILAAVAEMAGRCRKPPRSPIDIGQMLKSSIPQAAARIIAALDP